MKLNRTLYRIFLVASFLTLNGLILYGLSSVWSYLNTGADRATMLHLPAKLTSSYRPLVVWSPLENEGRPMEKQTLGDIERDYIKSWYVKNNALETNNHYGIEDYYTDSARVKLFRLLDFNKANKTTLKTTTIEHHPTIDFYSADGKMVSITDTNVTGYEELYINDTLVLKKPFEKTFKVLLLLEDGFWRIRHMVEHSTKKSLKTVSDTLVFDSSEIKKIKGVNYYPSKTPWDMFGKQFNDTIISLDFERINKMGLNTIRIFVGYEDFGKGDISVEKLEKLESTLNLAKKNDLKVILTLFDFYGDYTINDWTLTHRHAQQLVERFKNHTALLAWDLKNEPDLDFESRGKENVLAWLSQMKKEIRKWDQKLPITIGWSTPEAAINLKDQVDFISFHYYRKPVDFTLAYTKLEEAVPNKEIVLQEYGYSSYSGIWNAFTGDAQKQYDYYEHMQGILEKEQIPFVFWSLYDFEQVPNSVVGRLPWRKNPQRYFGILEVDGSPKPAYRLLEQKK